MSAPPPPPHRCQLLLEGLRVLSFSGETLAIFVFWNDQEQGYPHKDTRYRYRGKGATWRRKVSWIEVINNGIRLTVSRKWCLIRSN